MSTIFRNSTSVWVLLLRGGEIIFYAPQYFHFPKSPPIFWMVLSIRRAPDPKLRCGGLWLVGLPMRDVYSELTALGALEALETLEALGASMGALGASRTLGAARAFGALGALGASGALDSSTI